MMHSGISEVVERLYGCYQIIDKRWRTMPDEASHLWELTHKRSAGDILEDDLRTIGLFFAQADDLGQRSELYLIAEALTCLRLQARSVPRAPADAEALTESLARELMQPGERIKRLYTPLSYRVAQYAYTQGMIQEGNLLALREALLDLAHRLLLHDGNITPEEDERLRQFDAALG